jgi:RimJ/RimL family protein N-acetyltransferase
MYARTVRLETSRLLLRPLDRGDLDDFVALHSDPEVTRFVRPLDREAASARLDADAAEWRQRGHGILAIVERDSGAFLGRCGLKRWPQFEETELGWVLRRQAWGRGYATEAAGACVEWAFSAFDLPFVTAMINRDNRRSLRVAERLEMSWLRDDELLGDPVEVYWLPRPASQASTPAASRSGGKTG